MPSCVLLLNLNRHISQDSSTTRQCCTYIYIYMYYMYALRCGCMCSARAIRRGTSTPARTTSLLFLRRDLALEDVSPGCSIARRAIALCIFIGALRYTESASSKDDDSNLRLFHRLVYTSSSFSVRVDIFLASHPSSLRTLISFFSLPFLPFHSVTVLSRSFPLIFLLAYPFWY